MSFILWERKRLADMEGKEKELLEINTLLSLSLQTLICVFLAFLVFHCCCISQEEQCFVYDRTIILDQEKEVRSRQSPVYVHGFFNNWFPLHHLAWETWRERRTCRRKRDCMPRVDSFFRFPSTKLGSGRQMLFLDDCVVRNVACVLFVVCL